MNHHPVAWMMTALVGVGATALAVQGCDSSTPITRAYQEVCVAICEANDACEDRPGWTEVDLQVCTDECPTKAIEFEEKLRGQCDSEILVDDAQIDRCHDALTDVRSACEENDDAALDKAQDDYQQECPYTLAFACGFVGP